jgi:GNAT superfamily N-acetyltransferase
MVVRERAQGDEAWIADLLIRRWGGTVMVVQGESVALMDQPGLVAGEGEGLATYRIRGAEAELLSLDAITPGRGVGSLLLAALVEWLRRQGVTRLWVTTTNDNLAALRFYQRRGFRLQRLRPGAVDAARREKPAIPLLSEEGIPIRDELDLCCDL